MISQTTIKLPKFTRGAHIVTDIIIDRLGKLPKCGLCSLFLKHTSAGLTLNENADPSVLYDFTNSLDRVAPESSKLYTHNYEGADDMPAHIKSSLVGVSLTIPIVNGLLDLGTWQGIYLCEFRDYGGSREITATVIHDS